LPRLSLPAAAALLRQALGGGDDGDGVMLDATDVSLMDSYTLGRIAVPVRSIECEHFECFDAGTFHSAAMAKCPVCDREAGKNTLYVDTLFEAMARMGQQRGAVSVHIADGGARFRFVQEGDGMSSGAGGGGGGGGGGGRASAAAAAVEVVEIDLDDSDDDAGSGKSAAASGSSSTISGNGGGGGGAAAIAIASSSSSSSSSSSNVSGGGGAGKPEWVDVASLAAPAAAPAAAATTAAGAVQVPSCSREAELCKRAALARDFHADDKPMGMSQLRAYIKSGRPSAANSGSGSGGGGAAAGQPTAEPTPSTRAALLTQWTSSRRVRRFVGQHAYMVDQPPNMRYQVPGVGPGLAAKIIADGPFRCADRNMGNVLQSIDGLGAKTAARIVAALDKGLHAARVAERQAQDAQAAQVRSAQAASQHQAAQVAQAAQAAQALAQAARSPVLQNGKFHCLSCQGGAAEEQQRLFPSRHALSLHLRTAHRGANKLPAGVIYEVPGAHSGAGGAGKRPAGRQEDAQASKRQHVAGIIGSALWMRRPANGSD
jgi:hypothetical protein